MRQKRVIPVFKTEAEEASWWFKNRKELDKDFLEAARSGQWKRLTKEVLAQRIRRAAARVISIRVPEADLDMAKRQAAARGLPYQTYLKSLLHQALVRKQRKAG